MSLVDPGPDFFERLRPASFRGVPFAVKGADIRVGRRLALHEYPGRDKPYAEDMGKATRPVTMTGFLVTDSLVYGGGDVIDQRERMIAAAETAGPGILVHPTLGELTVACESLVTTERWDAGRYFELSFSFIESGERVFPTAATDTGAAVDGAADDADQAAGDDFVSGIEDAVGQGAAVLQAMLGNAIAFAAAIEAAARDACGLANLLSRQDGAFGRYFNRGAQGGFNRVAYPQGSTRALIAEGATAAAAVSAAAAGLLGVFPAQSQADVAAAARALVAALLAACRNPADAIRLLKPLCAFDGGHSHGPGVLSAAIATAQAATNAMFRRACVVALARASRQYQPSSADDALQLLGQLTGLIDAEMTAAGDAGDDAAYAALRILRTAVIVDLRSRGATLAPIVTFETAAVMPSLALAWRYYGTLDREAGLVQQVDPIHPGFMPVSFRALAR